MKRPIPRFMVILDQGAAVRSLPEVARAAISGGADLIQVREKELDRDAIRMLVGDVITHVGEPLLVSVNTHASVAAELGTNLHLPENVERASETIELERRALLGRSIHSAERIWSGADVDYLLLGNLFETHSKPGKPGLGVPEFFKIARLLPVPVLAIGGIRPATVAAAFEASAYGVAVSSYVNAADDPERAARKIRDEINKWVT